MSPAPSHPARWAPVLVCVAAFALCPAFTSATAAQTPTQQPTPPVIAPVPEKPLPWLVVDARGGYPSLGLDELTATGLGVATADLPGRARTLVVGAHVYPVRRGSWKIGLGGELLRSSGSSQKKDATGKAAGPVVHRRLNSVSAQLSLNFGRGAGWSYVTAGTGPFKFESYLDEVEPDGASASTINFGGGARWFNWDHVAFTVDLRFYLTKPANATLATAARERARIVLFSAGISIK